MSETPQTKRVSDEEILYLMKNASLRELGERASAICLLYTSPSPRDS